VIWVLVFAGIAAAGLVMLVSYAVWLLHKASDVLSEVRVLFDQGDQLATLLSQIEVPPLAGFDDEVDGERIVRGDYVTAVGK
jgi:hypothetical protein